MLFVFDNKMPGTRCAVAICNNSLVKTKAANLEITYHTFPKDEYTFKEWVHACRRKDKWNPKTSVICCIHFKDDDFERDLKAELLNLKLKRKLKSNAIPSQLIKPVQLGKGEESIVHETCTREDRLAKRQQKILVQEIVAPIIQNEPIPSGTKTNLKQAQELSADEKFNKLLCEHEDLKKKYQFLQNVHKEQKKELEKTQQTLRSIQEKFENECRNREQLEKTLGQVFSKSQREIIMKGKKKIKWSSEDISKAFTLRYLSKRCYIYLRNTLNYPLPHVATLVKWASKLNFKQGVLKDVLRLMEIAGMNFTPFEKIAVIQFDEMKVHSTYEYDKVH